MFTEEGPPRIARELDLRETVNFYVYYNNAILPGRRLKQKCNGRFSIGVREEIIRGAAKYLPDVREIARNSPTPIRCTTAFSPSGALQIILVNLMTEGARLTNKEFKVNKEEVQHS